jgi:hypothetical protein
MEQTWAQKDAKEAKLRKSLKFLTVRLAIGHSFDSAEWREHCKKI